MYGGIAGLTMGCFAHRKGEAFRGIKGKLYPAVCFDPASEEHHVSANFGQESFSFDTSALNALLTSAGTFEGEELGSDGE